MEGPNQRKNRSKEIKEEELTLEEDDPVKEFKGHEGLLELAQERLERDGGQMVVAGEVALEVNRLAAVEPRLHLAHQRHAGRTPEQPLRLQR